MTLESFTPKYEDQEKKPDKTSKELFNLFKKGKEGKEGKELKELIKEEDEKLHESLEEETSFFKNKLAELRNSIEGKYNDPLKNANVEIRNLLKNDNTDPITETHKTNQLINELSSQPENPIAKSYLKIVKILQEKIHGEPKPKELIKEINDVLDDKNIPYIMKKNLVKRLKENNYLLKNSFHQIEIENYLQKKFPQYDWSSFQPTIDPKDGKLSYTNAFA